MANPSDSSSIGSSLLIATCTVALLPAVMLAGWLIAHERASKPTGIAAERAIAEAEAFGDALDRWLTSTLAELRAWGQGRYEGPVGLDPTIGELGIRLALRIDDPATNAAVGVIDGMIGVDAIQRLADAFAQRSGAEVRILDADGALVAETESGHARDRILKLSPETMSREGWRIGVGTTGRSGGSVDTGVERGWVRLAEAEGPHRDWIVIAERKADLEAATRGGIEAATAGVGLAVVVGIAGGLWLRRRVAGRLGDLADAIERLGQGDVKNEIPADGNDDIARIGRGVEKMRVTMRRALQIINRQPA